MDRNREGFFTFFCSTVVVSSSSLLLLLGVIVAFLFCVAELGLLFCPNVLGSNRCGSHLGNNALNLDILSTLTTVEIDADDVENIDAFDPTTRPSGAMNAYIGSNLGDVKSKISEFILLSSIL